jgi:photosystem II stability/assembly factor-like uncharacterized protein
VPTWYYPEKREVFRLSRSASRLFAATIVLSSLALCADTVDPSLYAEMQWRCIGPFRAGRTVAVAGIPSQPNVFYMAPNNGGVWKTDDFGRTWRPIFDGQPTGSIGSLAIAPSDPNIIYVGSGEGLQRPDLSVGDGIYKSTDAGKTWQHLGLRNGHQIPRILADPSDPNRLFVAVLGHPYGPNEERGVYRSTDGGQTFQKVLGNDENTGGMDLDFDPTNPQTMYAVLWAARQAPWEVGESFQGPGSGLFKSIDGGSTWTQLTNGLPTIADGLGRIGFTVAPSDPNRLYATVDAVPEKAGVYRSDDAGRHWERTSGEPRVWSRGSDFAWLRVDPKDRDKLYTVNTSLYRSTDAGRTFHAIKGAPGGDDYHSIWINPTNPDVILLGVDQGATISTNGGRTWSSWWNQPTAQLYHVITDDRFPYWVYGGQQESGSAGVASRSDYGEITFRDFRTIGVEEYGYVAPDPLNPNVIFGGKATRYDWNTGDVQEIGPAPLLDGKYRFVRTMPLLFSPIDRHVLYLGSNVIFKTIDGGHSWTEISPDLARTDWEMPSVVGIYAAKNADVKKHRGVVYTIAPSYKDLNTIWAGTDDGLIHITRDGGKSWNNITPSQLTPWSKVSLIEASRFDAASAYAAINRIRLDDLHPYILRTHDGGKTWDEIVIGLPERAVVNSVREDPQRKGLLFAGTELGVFVSFNDGDLWQPLQLNLPVTSVRDLVIHGDDLVAATHGRSFWILDDITPLRELKAQQVPAMQLFKPQTAIRVRWNRSTDTPLTPEEPAGANPPDGAVIDYYLQSGTAGPVTLEIFDRSNNLVRRYASTDKPEEVNEKELNVPLYWIRPPQVLSAGPGMHRLVWDLHYAPPMVLHHSYPIAAIYRNTARAPHGSWALPGTYYVKLTVNGQSVTQPLMLRMDPRIKTSLAGLTQQFDLSTQLTKYLSNDFTALGEVKGLRQQLKQSRANASGTVSASIDKLDKQLLALESGSEGKSLSSLSGELAEVLNVIDGSDNAPTTQAIKAVGVVHEELEQQLNRWNTLKTQQLTALNLELKRAGLSEVAVLPVAPDEDLDAGEEEEP